VSLANKQISLGQPVTVIGQNGLLSGTANVSTASALGSSTVWVLLAVVVLAVLFLGRHK
jgi:CRP-like cAMP-binding protein